MTPRAKVVAVVSAAAVLAVGATVGVTLLQTRHESTGTKARKGAPPLELAVGGPLARAVSLYNAGKRSDAGAIFDRYRTLPAEIGSAFARWPHGSLDAVKRIVAAHPRSAVAVLHLGLAYYWSGRDADAAASWRLAATVEPDTPYAISALDFLHPNVAPGVPPIVYDPADVPRPARAKLAEGANLWNRERTVSARKALDAALALAPDDPVLQTAAAVALYSPAHPLRPFPRLGPLTGRYPKAAVVRFHLGVLLLWNRQVAKGTAQLRIAAAESPKSVYAQTAKQVLQALGKDGTT
jgi:tetratricopeptide (TPR) repeat protein